MRIRKAVGEPGRAGRTLRYIRERLKTRREKSREETEGGKEEESRERGKEGGKVSIKKSRRKFTRAVVLGMGLRLGTGLPRAADPLFGRNSIACVPDHVLENERSGAES